jgi:hypothetical protein
MITSQAQIRLAQNPSCISAPDGGLLRRERAFGNYEAR